MRATRLIPDRLPLPRPEESAVQTQGNDQTKGNQRRDM